MQRQKHSFFLLYGVLQIIGINLFFTTSTNAQQLPYFTQYKNNSFVMNPAVAGTKRTLDARVSYRLQWMGYEGAPSTQTVTLHSRFHHGKMGAGAYLVQDKIGPFKSTDIGLAYAYHIRFPDVELSIGVAGNYRKYGVFGDKITLHNTQDPAIDQTVNDYTKLLDCSAGAYLYNDRFSLGVSAQRLAESTAEFYKNDTTKKGKIKFVDHVNFTLGYNYAQNPDYVWESLINVIYVINTPINLDYTLRLHFKEKIVTGISLRLRDAVAIQVGYTFKDNFQVLYSYDLVTSKLKSYTSGSHEITLAYSTKLFSKKHTYLNTQFLRQKYGYMF